MICLQILAAVTVIYLLVGLLVAVVRFSAHDVPWAVFAFTVIFWPTLWMG